MKNTSAYKDNVLGKLLIFGFLLVFFLFFTQKQDQKELAVTTHSALFAKTQNSSQALLAGGFKIPQFHIKWTFSSGFEFLFAPAQNHRNTISNEFALLQFKVLRNQLINFKAASSRKIYLKHHFIKVNTEHPHLT